MTQSCTHLIPDNLQKVSEFMMSFWQGNTESEAVQGREDTMRL